MVGWAVRVFHFIALRSCVFTLIEVIVLTRFLFLLVIVVVCSGRIKKIALRYYMDYFDFSGLRLDMAFRCVFSFFLSSLCRKGGDGDG